MLSVVVVGRHAGMRRGLRTLLAEDKQVTLAAEVSFAGELLPLCRDARWDVIVLDVMSRDNSGQESLRIVHGHCPTARLVALTFTLDFDFLNECLAAGATALVASEDIDPELLSAIHAAAGGQAYLSRSVQAALNAGPGA